MTDLSRIDFSRCELPPWQDVRYSVHYIPNIIHPVHIRNGGIGSIAVRGPDRGAPWRIGTREVTATFEELEKLKSICANVDAFIASELKRMEEETLPPWRECAKTEALANKSCSEWAWLDHGKWTQWYSSWHVFGGGEARFRTRAPKPDPKKEQSGVEKFESLGTVKHGGCVTVQHVAGCNEFFFRPSPGYEYAVKLEQVASPKPEPKMPRVKPPDGWRWVHRQNKWYLEGIDDGETVLWKVPQDKSNRDATLACVAAYDNLNNESPVVFASQWEYGPSTRCDRSVLCIKLTASIPILPFGEKNPQALASHELRRKLKIGSEFILVEVSK